MRKTQRKVMSVSCFDTVVKNVHKLRNFHLDFFTSSRLRSYVQYTCRRCFDTVVLLYIIYITLKYTNAATFTVIHIKISREILFIDEVSLCYSFRGPCFFSPLTGDKRNEQQQNGIYLLNRKSRSECIF